MRVVVVGATGNVGTSTIEALSRDLDVDEIVGLARRLPDRSHAVDRTTFVAADVATDDLVAHFRGADVVVHLAWLFQPTHAPMVTWSANAQGSLRVFEAVAEARVPALVYASSVGAYSPVPAPGAAASADGRVHPRDEPVDESWPTHSTPMAAYGREKAYVERILDTFEAEHGDIRVVRLRPGFVFQRRAATEQRRLFAGPLLPRSLARPGLLPVLPLPAGFRMQFVHGYDIGEAYRLAAVSDASGAFNIAADPVIDAGRLGDALGTRTVELPRPLVRGAAAAGWHLHLFPADPALIDLALDLPLMDTARARTVLGWTARYTAVDALCELVEGMAAGAGAATAPLAPDTLEGRVEEVAGGVGERAT